MSFSSPTKVTPSNIPSVALAILYQDGRFLMQLRDNIPTIIYPDRWGFFGGHLEPGETPEIGVKREVLEEINYKIENPIFFRNYDDDEAFRHIFHAPLTVSIDDLILREGADLGFVSPEEVKKGQCYSKKLGDVRPLGKIHQEILLDFISK
ncbi:MULTISPECIES: NUDIX hydrolase [Crocosphaera]|uniref:NUDIX hydrolase n=2 Tax=Crocosphaera watsonii TaxID=263511 RepID=T2J9W2_CROWT|nr:MULTISPECIES: NUDIX hydrolase [Crocosphaera]MCH2244232.1 NUDIX hydrolase [Crocosphaera sp.]NQZ61251.1 NUDIX hydrolase [Crocosphaera sp.]CCQ51478.1 NUDIX hydrolase [Crocosphaera watsonii WH 8502]CCQ61936.1 NUDIX hydrolase [Crocosphaera watsonii WH 0401]